MSNKRQAKREGSSRRVLHAEEGRSEQPRSRVGVQPIQRMARCPLRERKREKEREGAYTLTGWEKTGLTPQQEVSSSENRAAPPGEREDRWGRILRLQALGEEAAEMSTLS